MGVAIGIDSHKRTLGAGATDELGRDAGPREVKDKSVCMT
jgi:hypothetical protein